jgi:hypothetical protein
MLSWNAIYDGNDPGRKHMDVTYHIKSLDDLAEHFEGMARLLRLTVESRKKDREDNELIAKTLDQVVDTVRRTVMDAR